MQRIPRELARKYAFDGRDEPLLRVQPGESFEFETWDAGTGYFRTPDDKAIPTQWPGFERSPPLANPIAGPSSNPESLRHSATQVRDGSGRCTPAGLKLR
jgi:amidase